MKKNEIVLFNTEDNEVELEVPVNGETVWLSRQQMAELFGRDVKTIGKHINNALHEELDNSTVANFATVQMEGYREVVRDIQYYNLDVIISVGYRVKSKRGVEFRKWANSVLKQYILQGYAVNSSRIAQLGEVIRVMKRTENTLDSRQVLSVIEKYSKALNMLDSYDHQNMNRPKGSNDTYRLTYEECINVISHMRFGDESALFGREKDDSFKGISVISISLLADRSYIQALKKRLHIFCTLLPKITVFLTAINELQLPCFCIFSTKTAYCLQTAVNLLTTTHWLLLPL